MLQLPVNLEDPEYQRKTLTAFLESTKWEQIVAKHVGARE